MEIFEPYDLIIDGTDNFATRYLVNERLRAAAQAVRVGLDLPVRRPGVRVLGGLRPLLPLPCTRSLRPPAWSTSCAEGGVLGVLCASIGSIQVTEANQADHTASATHCRAVS